MFKTKICRSENVSGITTMFLSPQGKVTKNLQDAIVEIQAKENDFDVGPMEKHFSNLQARSKTNNENWTKDDK